MEKIAVKNLKFAYPAQEHFALDGVNLSIESGDFAVICGKSGCGKTTLLRQLKTIIAPHGQLEGEILFDGVPLAELDSARQAAEIGFVGQSPEHQIITDTVWHELAFGLENIGTEPQIIRRRVAEIAAYFGMQEWFYQDTASLSGGQKQLLNLAAVMTMQPSVLILDEPTAQLDPIAAADFLAVLEKINRELGVTVLLTEHRLEEAFAYANKTFLLENGKVLFCGTPKELGEYLKSCGHTMFLGMPSAMRIWEAIENAEECPVTVREGSLMLQRYAQTHDLLHIPQNDIDTTNTDCLLDAEHLWFRYDQNGRDVICDADISLYAGEFFALMGGNGTGKTTLLRLLEGLAQPYRGEIRRNGKIALLQQNPQVLFVKKTVREDLLDVFGNGQYTEKQLADFTITTHLCRLDVLLERHPYDLSGGEQQRVALAKVLLCEPDILLLDEPTKGMDAQYKHEFAMILRDLLRDGKSVCMVSHDIEFCAEYADRCAMFFDGAITSQGSPREFFGGNSFYTTSANRMARVLLPDAITVADVVTACGGKLPENEHQSEFQEKALKSTVLLPTSTSEKMPFWRKIAAGICGAGALGMIIDAVRKTKLSQGVLHDSTSKSFVYYSVLCLLLMLSALFVGKSTRIHEKSPKKREKLSKRTVVSVGMILVAIPLTIWLGTRLFGTHRYQITAVAVLFECILPFFVAFEQRRPKAREIAVLAALCAIGIAGRAVFFMLPEFKPVMAVTILTGVALDGESGFLVGAVTMLASNVLFSQGPWTPWQMFAMGIVGFLAGVCSRVGLLRRSKISLSIFGVFSAIVIYGGILNPATAIIQSSEQITKEILLAYYISGFPMDCIHAFATVFFLLTLTDPMLEKLERICTKYGFAE